MKFKRFKGKIQKRLRKIGLIKKFSLFVFIKKKFNFLQVRPARSLSIRKLIVGKSRKPMIIGFVLILVAVSAYFLFFSSTEVLAEWWDTNWHYRKAITITNSGSAQTDFQVKALTNYDMSADVTNGKVQADFDDLRFTDINGNALDYWIEDDTAASLDVWIKISSIPTSVSTVYMYYGNANASSVQSGDDTFEFFDDFTGDMSKWGWNSGNAAISGSNTLDLSGATTILSASSQVMADRAWRFNFNSHYQGSGRDQAPILMALDSNKGYSGGKGIQVGNNSWTNQKYDMGNLSGSGGDNIYSSATAMTFDAFLTYEVYVNNTAGVGLTPNQIRQKTWNSSGTLLDDSGSKTTSNSTLDTESCRSTGYMGFTTDAGGGDMEVDWVFSRKYVATEPTVGIQSEEKSPGPVGYWSFDEGYGTTAQDRTSNNNDGTITGATWQTEDMCVSGKCLYFDGSSTYVNIPDNNSLDFGATTDFTVSLWFKRGDISGYKTIFAKGTGGWGTADAKSINITFAGNDHIEYDVDDQTNTVRCGVDNLILNDNNWHLLSVVFDRSANGDIYLDSESVRSCSISAVGDISNANSVRIGSRTDGYNSPGFIDEPKIYPYARTASQIKADYNSGKGRASTAKGAVVSFGNPQSSITNLSDGLVGYWKMDEGSWTNDCVATSVIDSSGNGNNGKACPATTGPTGGASGKFGNGGNFDGTDDYIDTGNTFESIFQNAFTFSLWAGPNDGQPADANSFWGIEPSGSNRSEWILLSDGTIQFTYIANGDRIDARTISQVFSDGLQSYKFLTLVVDPNISGSGAVKIYANGVEKTLGNSDLTGIDMSSFANSLSWTIGAHHYVSYMARLFNGKIDEVRIYNRALTEREVKALYEWAPGPVGHWKMDEASWNGTSNEVIDFAGNANFMVAKGTSGTATITTGYYGKGGRFTRTNQHFVCTNGGSDTTCVDDNDVDITADLTVSLWLKAPSTSNTVQVPVAKYSSCGYEIVTGSTGLVNLGGRAGDCGLYTSSGASTTSVYDDKWHFVSATRKDDKLSIYIDGKLENSAVVTSTGGWSYANSGALVIGAENASGANAYDGLIDDVRIYNYARTQKQILEDMNAGRPAQKSPVGYWKFDEGADNTCSGGVNDACDSSGYGNDGARTGATWTNEGKFGKALSFNGTSDYVDVTDPGSNWELDITDEFAFSMWIKQTESTSCCDSPLHHMTPWRDNGFATRVYGSDGSVTFVFLTNTGDDISASGYSLNTWYHFVGVYSKSNSIKKIFVNGIEKVSKSISTSLGITDNPLRIGAGSATWEQFPGLIDEVKIYNYALTDEEIKQEYNQGKVSVMGVVGGDGSGSTSSAGTAEYCIPGDTATCTPPVAEWKFDEKTGDYAYDTSGNGNTGTLTNMEVVDWKSAGECHSGACLDFDGGESNEYVITSSSLPSFTNFTVSVCAKWDDYGTSNIQFLTAGAAEQIEIHTGGSSGTNGLRFILNQHTESTLDISNAIPDSDWHCYTGVYTNNDEVIAYRDGVEIGSRTHSVLTSTTSNQFNIGRRNDGGYRFDGKIDQVRIYDYARTPAQIAWDYNKGKPVAHWRFDEGQGTTLYDESDNDNDGTLELGSLGQTSAGSVKVNVETAWYNGRNGKQNYSLNFDGDDDYVNCGNNTNLDITDRITLSAWFNRGTLNTSSWTAILSKEMSGGGYDLQFRTGTNDIGFQFYDNGSWRFSPEYTTLPDVWYHVIGTFDGSTIRLFVNGNEIGTGTVYSGNIASSTNNLLIANNPLASRHFNGQIDEVKVFNYALSPLQIKTEYNLGAARLGTGN